MLGEHPMEPAYSRLEQRITAFNISCIILDNIVTLEVAAVALTGHTISTSSTLHLYNE